MKFVMLFTRWIAWKGCAHDFWIEGVLDVLG